MRAEYYESLGWDERGVPRAEAIRELELDQLIGESALAEMAGIDAAGASAERSPAPAGRPS